MTNLFTDPEKNDDLHFNNTLIDVINVKSILRPAANIYFKKVKLSFLQRLFSKKIEWKAVGFIFNILPENVIYTTANKIHSRFSNIAIVDKIAYFSIFSGTKYANKMGQIDILLTFKDEADEAEFVFNSQDIMEDIKRELEK